MIINMLIFEKSYDDFMILSYDKVMITNNCRLRLFWQENTNGIFARSRKQ